MSINDEKETQKPTLKSQILIWIFSLAPLALVAIVYGNLPEKIPMHWSANGNIRYDDKVSIWFLASFSPFIALLFTVLPKIDPRKKNYEKFKNAYNSLCLFVMIFMLFIVGTIVSESFNPGRLNIEMIAMILAGLIITFTGNLMPKFKSNFFAGIRTPWTLSSDEVWHKTHRIAGVIWFYGGLMFMALSFTLKGQDLMYALLVLSGVLVFVPVVLSYMFYRKMKEEGK